MKKQFILFMTLLTSLSPAYGLSSNNQDHDFNDQTDEKKELQLFGVLGDGSYKGGSLDSKLGVGSRMEVNLNKLFFDFGVEESDAVNSLEAEIGHQDYYGKWRIKNAIEYSKTRELRGLTRLDIHRDWSAGISASRIFGTNSNYLMLGAGARLGKLTNTSKDETVSKYAPLFLTLDIHNEFGEKVKTDIIGQLTFTTDGEYKVATTSSAYLMLTKHLSLLARYDYESHEEYLANTIKLGVKLELK